MKPTFLLCLGLALTAHASWWSPSKPAYTSWSPEQLSAWLQEHNIPLPERKPTQPELTELVKLHWDLAAAWTHDQYSNAQKAFTDARDTSFDKWDESHLREFLLKQGIVAPKGPKEKLVQLARNQYKAYINAASSYSSRASTAVYGDATHQATQSLSSLASRATDTVSRTLDDTKDYVYSTWDDNRIRNYLESKGVQVKEKAQKSRKDLLGMMRDAYARVTRPVWEAWSDSYLHEWLVAHNIISPAPPAPYSRDYLLKKMTDYYYDANETVYSSWSESQLRDWLIKQGIVKPDAQIKREKLLKLVEDNYLSITSSIFDAWSDSQMRNWLVEHKYVDDRTASKKKRDDLVELMQLKYHERTSAPYVAWPDARLRAYLRQHNLPEEHLPTDRPGLLQEVRIRWVQTQTLWAKVGEIIGNMEDTVEDKLSGLWAVLRGDAHIYENMKRAAGEKYDQVRGKYDQGRRAVEEKEDQAKETVEEIYEGGKRKVGETFEEGKRKVGDRYEEGQRRVCETCEECKRRSEEVYERGKGAAQGKMEYVEHKAGRKYSDAEKAYEAGKERAYEKGQSARESAGEKVKIAGEKIKGEKGKVKGDKTEL